MKQFGKALFAFLLISLVLSCGKDTSPTGPVENRNTDMAGPASADPVENRDTDTASPVENRYIEGIFFVTIPTGSFEMGSDSDNETEQPVHTVTISSFDMSIYEITNAQYAAYLTLALSSGYITSSDSIVTGATGEWAGQSYFELDPHDSDSAISYSDGCFIVEDGRENKPVNEVTWYGAMAFVEYYGLDLPTEAEWEYACRAGTNTEYYGFLYKCGWYWETVDMNAEYPLTNPVGQKEPNAWGLYDMHGNVYEWCLDWYDESYYSSSPSDNPPGPVSGSERVIRGGSYRSLRLECRSAHRCGFPPGQGICNVGFCVARPSFPCMVYE